MPIRETVRISIDCDRCGTQFASPRLHNSVQAALRHIAEYGWTTDWNAVTQDDLARVHCDDCPRLATDLPAPCIQCGAPADTDEDDGLCAVHAEAASNSIDATALAVAQRRAEAILERRRIAQMQMQIPSRTIRDFAAQMTEALHATEAAQADHARAVEETITRQEGMLRTYAHGQMPMPEGALRWEIADEATQRRYVESLETPA